MDLLLNVFLVIFKDTILNLKEREEVPKKVYKVYRGAPQSICVCPCNSHMLITCMAIEMNIANLYDYTHKF